ncbi:3D domain-containing protein [Vagococcus fluvialis]|uniref:3D domain-containing protein n=1 Tax=Vagococcus fluvialis TaxID=2738 RepID=UPI003B213676
MKKEIGMKVKGVVIVKVKGLSIMLFSIVALSFSPVVSLATSSKEDSVKKESVEISSKIDKALDSVNAKYQEVETLKAEVSATEKTIQETQVNIEKTEASIAKRTEAMAERMQHMQSNSSSFNLVDALLSAENMSDFFNRAYAVTVLQGAEKSKVDSLAEDKMKLEELRADLEKNKSELTQKEATMAQEVATLESGVASLKEELNNNQEVLAKLSNDRIAEESRAKKAAAEEANRKEIEKHIQQKAEEESTTSSEKAPDSTENTQVKPDPKPPVTTEPSTPDYEGGNNNGGGATMNMVATGYSYTQPGLSFYTATGIDLRVNSRVIAVDPNTIPLGSLVEVSGYGMAIAGDTGGDIVGNRIDVHFNSEEECWNWGRRNVTVTMR